MRRPKLTVLRVFVLLVLSFCLTVECYLLIKGLSGPTLLYISDSVLESERQSIRVFGPRPQPSYTYASWIGKGNLPQDIWQSMFQGRGYAVQAADPGSNDFWGGMTANHGEWMFATGPGGIALAVCWAPDSSYGGYMRCVVGLPHLVCLLTPILLGMYFCLALQYGPLLGLSRWLKRKCMTPPGHCQGCGYNLRGLRENRCPECGLPFEPNDRHLDLNNPI